jgi:hypothetical protein
MAAKRAFRSWASLSSLSLLADPVRDKRAHRFVRADSAQPCEMHAILTTPAICRLYARVPTERGDQS